MIIPQLPEGFVWPSDMDRAENDELNRVCEALEEVLSVSVPVSQNMVATLTDISNACIGDLTMSYMLDAQLIGEQIYQTTGLTNPQLNELCKELLSDHS